MTNSQNKQPQIITVRRSFLGELLVLGICRRSLWKSFHSVKMRAIDTLPMPPSKLDAPIVFYNNHNTWWDGYLAHVVMRQIYGLEPYLPMDVRQLQSYRFFSWAGCFSIDRQSGRSAVKSLEYVANELQTKAGRAVWFFPQGEIVPHAQRPLAFQSGLGWLIRKLGDCYVYPVSTRFEFTREQYPEIFMHVGAMQKFSRAERPDTHTLTRQLEATLTADLDQLQTDLANNQLTDFVTVLQGKASTDTSLRWLLKRLSRS